MKGRDLIVGGVVVVLLIVLFNRINDNSNSPEPVGDVLESSFQDELAEDLGVVLNENSERKEVSNGENRAVIAKTENSLSVLADLEETNETYQVWSGETSLGVLSPKKGGYVFETSLPSGEEVSSITISREKVVDNTQEEKVLETSF